mmetsp:Transcript_156265/g.501349  ORF Transcript_156265/g.501349 Transcript_156265/m.501349 type:complete len:1146 (-) Transcript_156265:88-3525(-)
MAAASERAHAAMAGGGGASLQVGQEAFLEQRLLLPGYRLLILDGCCGLYKKCGQAFVCWLKMILAENPHLQVLITARTPVREAVDDMVHKDDSTGVDFASNQEIPSGVVEVRELSESDALRLLRWRCHVLPEAAAFLEEHGAHLAALCGRLPMALCVCARWLVTQLPRTDPRQLLESMEDEAKRLKILRPCALVFDAAVAVLPEVLRRCLPAIARLHSNFSADIAAAVWAVEQSEAELRLDAFREHHLLDFVQVGTDSGKGSGAGPSASSGGNSSGGGGGGIGGDGGGAGSGTTCSGVALPVAAAAVLAAAARPLYVSAAPPAPSCEASGSLYRMQPLLRLHLRRKGVTQPASDTSSSSSAAATDAGGVGCSARLVAGYAARVFGSLAHQEEFPNIQLVLDLAGVTQSFLVTLWAVRSAGWAHAWLGEERLARLYERALAVLAVLGDGGSEAGEGGGDGRSARVGCRGRAGAAAGGAARMPSDAYLEAAPGGNADVGLVEVALRSMVNSDNPPRPGASWNETPDSLFVDGSNVDPKEVLGPVLCDTSLPVLRHGDRLDAQALPLLAGSPAAASLLASLARPLSRRRLEAEALVELASATRSSDPAWACRLAHCAAARLTSGGLPDAAVKDDTADADAIRPLLADALGEFALCLLALRGLAARPLTSELLGLAVELGQASDPLRPGHLRLLRRASLHALAFEGDPCKAERLQKKCMELKLQKFKTWQHPEIAETLGDCGSLCHVLGDYTHAESMLRTAVSVWRHLLPPSSPRLASALLELAGVFAAQRAWGEAEGLCQEAIAIFREAPDGTMQLYQAMNGLALLQQHLGRPELALPLLRDCLSGLKQVHGADADASRLDMSAVRHNLGSCLLMAHMGCTERARASAEEAHQLLELAHAAYAEQLPASSPASLAVHRALAQCCLALGRPNEAVTLLEPTLRLMESLGSYSAPELGSVHFLLGRALMDQKDRPGALRHFEFVLQRPCAADKLSAVERGTAEEELARGCDADDDSVSCKTSPPKAGVDFAPGRVGAVAGPGSSEPQTEPAPSAARPADATHLGFRDVDLAMLAVLNRAPYLMAGRFKECLGTLPPLADAHQLRALASTAAATVAPLGLGLPPSTEHEMLNRALARMEVEIASFKSCRIR